MARLLAGSGTPRSFHFLLSHLFIRPLTVSSRCASPCQRRNKVRAQSSFAAVRRRKAANMCDSVCLPVDPLSATDARWCRSAYRSPRHVICDSRHLHSFHNPPSVSVLAADCEEKPQGPTVNGRKGKWSEQCDRVTLPCLSGQHQLESHFYRSDFVFLSLFNYTLKQASVLIS